MTFDMDATLPFVGRLLIGLPFAMSGLGKLAAYGKTTAMIAAVGLPVPPLATPWPSPSSLVEDSRWSRASGFAQSPLRWHSFAFAAAVSFHSNFADQNQMIHFLKDVMMAGGLL